MGRDFRTFLIASATIFILFLFQAAPRWLAAQVSSEAIETHRRARMVSHLKRLHEPEDWRLVRKLFSSNRRSQMDALRNCPTGESEWPWFLSSGYLDSYAFSADFLPVNMDADEEEETLLVLQSDPGEVQYITFCLLDDKKRGRLPLTSFSDISRGMPITYQLTDLTGDRRSEIVLYTREGATGSFSDSVRIIKLNRHRQFKLVWFSRLRDELHWTAGKSTDGGTIPAARRERLQVRMRLRFDGPKKPATIILKGEREYEERVSDTRSPHTSRRTVFERIPFEERWRWNAKLSQFVLVSLFE